MLDADLLERHIMGRTPFANFILDMTFTLFRRLIRRVTSIELLVVVASCAAAACIPAGPAVRIALVVSVTAGIACGGLWVWGKERPQNRDVHGDHRTPSEQTI
jgi:hypothetical protein